MEDDDKLKELFSDFQPDLSSDFQFMKRLERNMEAVELVKRRSEAVRKRNKIAVVVAAFSGFVVGVILTLLYPLVRDTFSTIQFKVPYIAMNPIAISGQVWVWICIALASNIIAYNAYVITVSRLSVRETI